MKREKKQSLILLVGVTIVIIFGGLILGKVFGLISSVILMLLSRSNLFYISQANIEVITENMSFCGIIVLIYLYQWGIKKESVKLLGLDTTWKNGGKQYITGLLISILMMTGLLTILLITGTIHIGSINKVNLIGIILVFISIMIQSFAEEFVFRGFLFQYVKKIKGVLPGIIVTNILFAFLHFLNAGNTVISMVNICLIGIVFNVITLKTGDVFTSSAIHAGWNFLNEIVFGLPNSGLVTQEAIIPSFVDNNSIWFHSINGAEGGLAATTIFMLSLVIALSISRIKWHSGLSSKF